MLCLVVIFFSIRLEVCFGKVRACFVFSTQPFFLHFNVSFFSSHFSFWSFFLIFFFLFFLSSLPPSLVHCYSLFSLILPSFMPLLFPFCFISSFPYTFFFLAFVIPPFLRLLVVLPSFLHYSLPFISQTFFLLVTFYLQSSNISFRSFNPSFFPSIFNSFCFSSLSSF